MNNRDDIENLLIILLIASLCISGGVGHLTDLGWGFVTFGCCGIIMAIVYYLIRK